MLNPIIQMLSEKNLNKNNRIAQIISTLAGKSSREVYYNMIQNNPQFRQFVKDNEGKTIEEIAMSYDIDIDMIKKFL